MASFKFFLSFKNIFSSQFITTTFSTTVESAGMFCIRFTRQQVSLAPHPWDDPKYFKALNYYVITELWESEVLNSILIYRGRKNEWNFSIIVWLIGANVHHSALQFQRKLWHFLKESVIFFFFSLFYHYM